MEYALLKDDELVTQVYMGHTSAMSVLYDRYARLVFSLAFKILCDRSAAEDTVQEVFVKVWRHSGDYDVDRSKFSSWVCRIAHNYAIDELRRRRARATESEEDQATEIPQTGPTPLDLAMTSLEHRRIDTALQRITADQRRAIEMAYFEGLTHDEIANRLGEPLGTIKTRIRRGMQKLKVILDETS